MRDCLEAASAVAQLPLDPSLLSELVTAKPLAIESAPGRKLELGAVPT